MIPGECKDNVDELRDIRRGSLGIHATPSEIWYSYFLFLCDLVEMNGADHARSRSPNTDDKTYFMLALKMHTTRFKAYIPNDDNRIGDARKLRVWFAQIHSAFDNYDAIDTEGCSMLEMMIALAQRIDRDVMMGIDDPDRSIKWFWEMMDNCGLSTYTDDKFNEFHSDNRANTDDMVTQTLTCINDRTYDYKGFGGLFPLDNAVGNAPEMELWMQMQAYFMEKYINAV